MLHRGVYKVTKFNLNVSIRAINKIKQATFRNSIPLQCLKPSLNAECLTWRVGAEGKEIINTIMFAHSS